jgi:tripartite-type tricarboxylate transporter receptor subunit TctC
VTSPQRSPLAPEVPTLVESGIADVDVPSWYTLLVPARTPSEVTQRLRAEMKRVAANGEFTSQLARQAIDVQVLAPGEYTTFLKGELAKWADIVRSNGLKAE